MMKIEINMTMTETTEFQATQHMDQFNHVNVCIHKLNDHSKTHSTGSENNKKKQNETYYQYINNNHRDKKKKKYFHDGNKNHNQLIFTQHEKKNNDLVYNSHVQSSLLRQMEWTSDFSLFVSPF